MKIHGLGDQLINILMEETFGNPAGPESGADSGDLLSYFNHKKIQTLENKSNHLEDIFKRRPVQFFRAVQIDKSSVLRFKINNEILDFPRNWSLFACFHEESENLFFKSGKAAADDDKIFEVLTHFLGGANEICFVKYEQSIYLVHTKLGSNESLDWIESFLFSDGEQAAA